MLSDAIATGRPVGMIPVRATPPGRAWLTLWRALRPRHPLYPRDLPRFWAAIAEGGLVGSVAQPAAADAPDVRVVAREAVLALFPGAATTPLAEGPASA